MSWNFVSYRPIPQGTDVRWQDRARCKDTDPDAPFVEGREQQRAKQFCTPCPVRYECLAYALDHRVEWGVWGGKTERERRLLLRRRTGSWRALFRARGWVP